MQQSKDDSSSLCTMDKDTYESLHLLVGKIKQSNGSGNKQDESKKEQHAFKQPNDKSARVKHKFPSSSNAHSNCDKKKVRSLD